MAVMDIDHFKHINDSYGRAYGDLVLRRVADCICETVSEKELCGRFGGDEFLILLPDTTRGELIALSDRFIVKMKETVRFPDPADAFGVSIGTVLYPLPGEDSKSLFQNADTALYEVKTTGGRMEDRLGYTPEPVIRRLDLRRQ